MNKKRLIKRVFVGQHLPCQFYIKQQLARWQRFRIKLYVFRTKMH